MKHHQYAWAGNGGPRKLGRRAVKPQSPQGRTEGAGLDEEGAKRAITGCQHVRRNATRHSVAFQIGQIYIEI